MCKTFIKAGVFAMALVATSAFAEGTVDPNHPDSRFQSSSQTAGYMPSESDIRNANSAVWGVGG